MFFILHLSMSFINSEINVADLPAAETVQLRSLHPSYLKVLRIEWLITTSILLVIAGVLYLFLPWTHDSLTWIVIGGVIVVISALHLISIEKSHPCKAFAVRDRDVIYQTGWLVRTTKVCPFARIQNCSTQMGPLERNYGLASLSVFTAGSEGADIRIPGLLQEEADQLRHFILQKIHKETDESI